MITLENTVKTSTHKKAEAKRRILSFAYNYPEEVLPFSVLEDKIYEITAEYKMTFIESIRLFSRVLNELGVTLGSDFTK